MSIRPIDWFKDLCGTNCAEEGEDDDWTTRAVVHLYRAKKCRFRSRRSL